jgi:hypothetical protein
MCQFRFDAAPQDLRFGFPKLRFQGAKIYDFGQRRRCEILRPEETQFPLARKVLIGDGLKCAARIGTDVGHE